MHFPWFTGLHGEIPPCTKHLGIKNDHDHDNLFPSFSNVFQEDYRSLIIGVTYRAHPPDQNFVASLSFSQIIILTGKF